ncbi:MAG TPA: hypothetical protein VD863_06985 [Bradyrhizobium sp.]|nr:hypothetical protein [Bradyrhizobium sp.]
MGEDTLPPGWPAEGLRPHPIAGIFRMLDEAERGEFRDSLDRHGLRIRIKMYEGMVLDGRNRYRELMALGMLETDSDWRLMPSFFEEFSGTREQAIDYVFDANHVRRHDNPSQRAMAAARYATMRQGQRTDIKPSANLRDIPVSQAEAAEKLGVSERLVSSAAAVIDHGTPELIEAVDEGRLTASAGAEVAKLEAGAQRVIAAMDKHMAKAEAARVSRAGRKAKAPTAPSLAPYVAFANLVLELARTIDSIDSRILVRLAFRQGLIEGRAVELGPDFELGRDVLHEFDAAGGLDAVEYRFALDLAHGRLPIDSLSPPPDPAPGQAAIDADAEEQEKIEIAAGSPAGGEGEARPASPQAGEDGDDPVAAGAIDARQLAGQPSPADLYDTAVASAASLAGRHTIKTAEAVLRAGVAAEITRKTMAADLGHPIGTVLSWTAKLGLTGLGSGWSAPRKRA